MVRGMEYRDEAERLHANQETREPEPQRVHSFGEGISTEKRGAEQYIEKRWQEAERWVREE